MRLVKQFLTFFRSFALNLAKKSVWRNPEFTSQPILMLIGRKSFVANWEFNPQLHSGNTLGFQLNTRGQEEINLTLC